jgi:hypothetical protein
MKIIGRNQKDVISQKNISKHPRQEKDLSDVNSSLLDGEANHKFTVESVPALCKRLHFIRKTSMTSVHEKCDV